MSFPRYPKYKASGVEWLGEVPEAWEVKRFRFCVKSSNAGEVIDRTYWHSGDELFFSCQRDPMTSNFADFPTWKRTSAQDLLVTRNATPYVHIPPANAIYSNVVQRCILSDGLLRIFVANALATVCARLREDGYGVSIPSFSYEKWCNLHLPIPPLPEQTAIAEFLDRETAKIDALVAEQRRLMDLLKEKRQAVISHAVTKGLNPNAPMKPSGIEWLGDVPVHWSLPKLKSVATFSGGGTPSRDNPAYWNGDIPWVSPKDMKAERIVGAEESITEKGLRSSASSLLPPGRILIVVRSGILKHTIPIAINETPVALNQDMKALSFDAAKCLGRYFFRWVQGHNDQLLFAWSKQGATVESIEHSYLAQTVVPLPDIREQAAIVSFLDTELAKFDTLTAEAQKAIDLLQERRTALISAAVTGQIDVRGAGSAS